MAKLPPTGVGYQCLDERGGTLPEIIASLGLKPLKRAAERKIRDRLGFALALWEEPYTAIQVNDVVRSLNLHAKHFDKVVSLGAITRQGFARSDELAVSGELVRALTSEPMIGTVDRTHAYLSEFCDRAGVIASGCRAAAGTLSAIKGKSGKSRYRWYDEFTAVLLVICNLNDIEPTVGLDPVSGKAVGTLSEIASAFERLLLPKMRSRKPPTMVKRLQRSLERLREKATEGNSVRAPDS